MKTILFIFAVVLNTSTVNACPDFSGTFREKNSPKAPLYIVQQDACNSVTTEVKQSSSGSQQTITDGILRDHEGFNGRKVPYLAYFDSNSLVVNHLYVDKKEDSSGVSNLEGFTKQLRWETSSDGLTITQSAKDMNGQEISWLSVRTEYTRVK